MQILKVHIQNINSLRGTVRLDFDERPLAHAGIFAITGPTGAGKSTILDCITLALYGKVARNKQVKEVISYGSLSCVAEVEFIVDEQRYLASWRLHRARNKPDGKLVGPNRELAQWEEEAQVFRPVAEKIKEVDQAVERITRLDYQRFSRSVLLSQGDFAAFLRASDGERSELLERITGTSIYGELSTAAFRRHKQEQEHLQQLQKRLEQTGVYEGEPVDEAALAAAKAE
ncbi:MAG: AAA family ATPase, partial [Bacteroidota bacterium]